MSRTRYAADGAPISQERYLSSPEYAELRGISGNAVVTKAALLRHPQKRKLLFFLQAMSLKDGGLKSFCRDFLSSFEDRIGTETMHKNKAVHFEGNILVHVRNEIEDKKGFGRWEEEKLPRQTRGELFNECREKLFSTLEGFIVELCINPTLYFSAPGETEIQRDMEKMIVKERFESKRAENESWQDWKNNSPKHESSALPWFKDIIGALFEFQRRYEAKARADLAETQVAKEVFETLDFGLIPSKSASKTITVVEGNSGVGKSKAGEAWTDCHLGEARIVSLAGITSKTSFFRACGKALGIGATMSRSSTELQSRVEDILQRSGLMLVIDEAHFLFSAAERVYSRPELVDWLGTAAANHGVKVGLICTPQFALRMTRAQKQTTWNAEQIKRRCKAWQLLPARPSRHDIEMVAEKMLPGADAQSIKLVTGYALASQTPFAAMAEAIDQAARLVSRDGREEITFDDLQEAITHYAAQSARAMSRTFEVELGGGRRARRKATAAPRDDETDPSARRETAIDFVPSPAARRGQNAKQSRRETPPMEDILKAV